MSDSYQLASSSFPQTLDESPYVSKVWNFVNDINGGQYSSQGPVLIQYELGALYNSSTWTDCSEHFIAVPLNLTSCLVSNATAGTTLAPVASTAWAVHAMKQNYANIIHSAELVANGKTVKQASSFEGAYVAFKMLSEMSNTDLKNYGSTLGFGINSKLDQVQSYKYNCTANQLGGATGYPGAAGINNLGLTGGFQGGNGLVNNNPWPLTLGATGQANQGDMSFLGSQFSYSYNDGLYSRLCKPIALDAATNQNFYLTSGGNQTNCLQNEANIRNEFASYTLINATYYITTLDVAIIRMADVFDFMKKVGIVRKLDAQLKLYINTGSVGSVTGFGATIAQGPGACGSMMTSASTSTYQTVCPFMQCALTTIQGIACTGIVTGLGIVKAPTTNLFGGVNLANATVSHPMTSTRYYYSSIVMKGKESEDYELANRAKRVCYESILYNFIQGVTATTAYSSLLQSGVSNIKRIIIMPFVSASVNGAIVTSGGVTGVTPFAQYSSPLDSAPNTVAPISLTYVNAQIGGINVFAQPLQYGYEQFLEQFLPANKDWGSEFGQAVGLINENMWRNGYKFYVIDCTRCNRADQKTPRNITLQFTNNSQQTLDFFVFTTHEKELVVDVVSSSVTEAI